MISKDDRMLVDRVEPILFLSLSISCYGQEVIGNKQPLPTYQWFVVIGSG